MQVDQLLAMQRQFMAALREPLVGDSRARTDLPAGPGAPSPAFAAAAAWLTPSAALTPVDRLELYHRQYWYRLLDSLAEDFPATHRVLGTPRFWALLERYLTAEPPSRFSLRDLGAGLAAFVAARPAEVAHAAHVIDLVRLEYAWIVAFDAAELPAAPADALATTPLALQPHVTLLALRTPADTWWRRTEAGQPRGRLRPARRPDRFVAVYRDGLQRQLDRLHPAAHALLSAIASDGDLDRALEAAAPRLPPRRGAALIRSWFRQWTERRWLVARAGRAGPDATQRS
jgi:hypothetical protein